MNKKVIRITEADLHRMVSEAVRKVMNEKVVDKFTPYTPEEREQNFIPFTSKDKRSSFERNPSYERALRAAQERRRMNGK